MKFLIEKIKSKLSNTLIGDLLTGDVFRRIQANIGKRVSIMGLAWLLGARSKDEWLLALRTRSQLGQELIAQFFAESGNKYFVEFGAADGLDASNTFFLEKKFGWRGILAEPAQEWHAALMQNRSCFLDFRAVWASSGLTTHIDFSGLVSKSSLLGPGQPVETVSLTDLMRAGKAPNNIGFLSIDTEGGELEILKSFDFTLYRSDFICVEHNYRLDRQELISLLESQGYVRVLEDRSKFDLWFVSKSVARALQSRARAVIPI